MPTSVGCARFGHRTWDGERDMMVPMKISFDGLSADILLTVVPEKRSNSRPASHSE
jgi:hypothetical protein